MPIIGTPTASTPTTLSDVRQFMRDVPGIVAGTGVINILLSGSVEFSDDDIRAAIRFTTNWFTALPPMIGLFTEATVPPVVMLYGAAAHLLNSEAMRQLRNQASVQDGDTQPIGIDDKHQLYLQAAKVMREEFLNLAQRIKIQINMSRAYGGIASGYAQVSRNHSG